MKRRLRFQKNKAKEENEKLKNEKRAILKRQENKNQEEKGKLKTLNKIIITGL